METIIRYRALDGEEFSTQNECMEWEKKINNLPFSITWFDKNGNKLRPTYTDMEVCWLNTNEIKIWNLPTYKEELQFMKDYWGIMDQISEPGNYKATNISWERIM